jgi:predicted transcriptional regulator
MGYREGGIDLQESAAFEQYGSAHLTRILGMLNPNPSLPCLPKGLRATFPLQQKWTPAIFMADEQALIELTADIVSAHVSNNTVSLSDVPVLVQQVHAALAQLGAPQAEAEPQGKTPVVSARASVKPDFITCMECGQKQKTLKRHLMAAHGLTPDQYRKDYGLPNSYPMVAPSYSAQRGALAKAIGLGRKKAEPAAEPQAEATGKTRSKAPRLKAAAAPQDAAPKRTRRKLTIA